MKRRKVKEEDVPVLREIFERAGYVSEFPDVLQMKIGYVLEHEGRVVGWAGAQMEAQIMGIFDPQWGSPHERVKTFASLHLPIAKELKKHGVQFANILIESQFKNFGRRLMKLGWFRNERESYRMSVAECIEALNGR